MNNSSICILFYLVMKFSVSEAQSTTLNITSSNIGIGVLNTNVPSFTGNSCILAVSGYIKVRANADFSPTINPSFLSAAQVSLYSIGTTSNPSGSTGPQSLSTVDKSLYTSFLAISLGGGVDFNYQIPQSAITNYAWLAGNYTTGLTFTTPGGALCTSTTTFPFTLNLNVAAFANLSPTNNIVLNVNGFTFFTSSGISGTQVLTSSFTVPLGLKVATSAANLTYSNGYSGATDPGTSTAKVSAQITSPTSGTAVNLSTAYQNISPNGGYAVPVGNSQSNTVSYSISAANLISGFVQAGTYTTTLNYQASNAIDGSVPSTQNETLTINVSNMGNLVVNNPSVILSFNTLSDYQNGVSVNMPNHLTISNTSAYDIYVKASGNLINGSINLPIGAIKVGPGTSQTGVAPVTLTTTAQKIISASIPVINRNVAIQYSIAASSVSQLLGNPAGTYTTTVTYSFVAP